MSGSTVKSQGPVTVCHDQGRYLQGNQVSSSMPAEPLLLSPAPSSRDLKLSAGWEYGSRRVQLHVSSSNLAEPVGEVLGWDWLSAKGGGSLNISYPTPELQM
jgi:hypothetical protein